MGADEIFVDQVNPWKHKWIATKESPIEVSDPLYPNQKHFMSVYLINVNGYTIKFAAGEFLNGVWGFYVPG